MQHKYFFANIQGWWHIKIKGTTMYYVFTKIQGFKSHLKKWNKEHFWKFNERKVMLQEKLGEINKKIEAEGRSFENDE